jgi:hypothetical protein
MLSSTTISHAMSRSILSLLRLMLQGQAAITEEGCPNAKLSVARRRRPRVSSPCNLLPAPMCPTRARFARPELTLRVVAVAPDSGWA